MKRRITIGLAVPVAVGMMAIGSAIHYPVSRGFAAASTPPPPPTFVPTPISTPPPPPTTAPTEVPTTAPPTSPPATTPPAQPTPTPVPTTAPPATSPPVVPPTVAPTPQVTKAQPGAGGTYRAVTGRSAQVRQGNRAATSTRGTAASPSQLPRTGGASGGNDPTAPLAPLALLGALAIAAGRLIKR